MWQQCVSKQTERSPFFNRRMAIALNGRFLSFCWKTTKIKKEVSSMTKTELIDNMTFLSAVKMLERLVTEGLLSDAEAEASRKELEHRLRPTLLFA